MKRLNTYRTLMAALKLNGLVIILALSPLSAQEEDPFAKVLFDAELVMSNQEAIGLEGPQRKAIIASLARTQAAVVEPQLELAASGERLIGLLSVPKIDMEEAILEVDLALQYEGQVKIEYMRLLIEIKNLLKPEQMRRLEAIRERR